MLAELNDRLFQRLPCSRRSVFETLDRPEMRALPAAPYVYAQWKSRTVAFDYHVEVDRHYYSVPHGLVGHEVWARYSAATVEVFFRAERVLIQLAEGASTGKEGKASILALLGQHLSMMKHPRHIEFVGELPRDDTGKLKKRRLRESYLARTMAPADVAARAEANVALT